MAGGFACYHHCNDHDRAAVATCSKCGKALCAECTDLFRSDFTGKILCIECRNAEIKGFENSCAAYAARQKKEMIMMIVGGVIGLILAIVLTGTLGFIGYLYLPFLLASIGFIWQRSFGKFGILVGAICFIGMLLVSPIMFVVRLTNRVKSRKNLAYVIEYNQKARRANNAFFEYARGIKRGLTSEEIKKLTYQLKATEEKMRSTSAQLQKAQTDLSAAEARGDSAAVQALRQEVNALKQESQRDKAQMEQMQKQMNEQGNDIQSAIADIKECKANEGDMMSMMATIGTK